LSAFLAPREVDDDDEIDRLLWELGLELPDVADDAPDDALPSRLEEEGWD
jgi:hypothetical protein